MSNPEFKVERINDELVVVDNGEQHACESTDPRFEVWHGCDVWRDERAFETINAFVIATGNDRASVLEQAIDHFERGLNDVRQARQRA